MAEKNGTPKPKVAFFDFTSCEGCQLAVIDSLQTHPELLEAVEIVEFREAMSEKSYNYEIAFVEGSCTRPGDEDRLHQIREIADVVVALGACAHLGGINAIRNRQSLPEVREAVYGEKAGWYETYEPRAISEVVAVDVVIPGCPIDRYEFLKVVKALIRGIQPVLPDYPVCMECKQRGTVCLYYRGETCLGPITRAGCNAICTYYGFNCVGCRGLVSQPNMPAFEALLTEHGLPREEAVDKLTMFLTNQTAGFKKKEKRHA